MSQFITFVRYEDEFGSFDHPKDARPQPGWRLLKDYPEHVGRWARDPKPRTDKGGASKPRERKTEKPDTE